MRPWIFRSFSKGIRRRESPSRAQQKTGLLEEHDDDYDSDVVDSLLASEFLGKRAGDELLSWRFRGVVMSLQYVATMVLAALNCWLLFMLWMGRIKVSLTERRALLPRLSVDTPRVFFEDIPYTVYTQDRGAAAWKCLTEVTDIGVVYIQDSKSANLVPSGIESDVPGYGKYQVSMYTQLRCLGAIRRMFYTLEISPEDAYSDRFSGCFDYLRQSLTCSADLTLEHTSVGLDVEHLCKDQSEVEALMHKYSKEKAALH